MIDANKSDYDMTFFLVMHNCYVLHVGSFFALSPRSENRLHIPAETYKNSYVFWVTNVIQNHRWPPPAAS